MTKRKKRKLEHLRYSIALEQKTKRNVFSDIKLIHSCLSEVNLDEVDISTSLKGINLNSPMIINAITGGMKEGYEINLELAKVARELGLAMAVGSQKIAIKDRAAGESFRIVRKINPKGIVFANMGADVTISEAKKAVEMIEADGLQLHLNAPQELVMSEGRRKFKGTLENICDIAENIEVPVIVKEVGFGMAREEAKLLVENNIKILDVGGRGGTNFITIENARSNRKLMCIEDWGIPTAASLIEVMEAVGDKADIICSGGLKDGYDVAKAIALGAKAVALAGKLLYILVTKGTKALTAHILNMNRVLKYVMVMVGADDLEKLRNTPTVITGKTREWLKNRGLVQ